MLLNNITSNHSQYTACILKPEQKGSRMKHVNAEYEMRESWYKLHRWLPYKEIVRSHAP